MPARRVSPYQGGPAGTDRALAVPGWVGGWPGAHQTGPRGRSHIPPTPGPCRAFRGPLRWIWDLAVVDPGMSVGPVLPTRYTHPVLPHPYPPWCTHRRPELVHAPHDGRGDHWDMYIWPL